MKILTTFLSVLFFLSISITNSNAVEKKVLHEGKDTIIFDITIYFDQTLLALTKDKDAFTGKISIKQVQGFCNGGMEILYTGTEDFIFDKRRMFNNFNLLFDNPAITGESIYTWFVDTDVVYQSGETIKISQILDALTPYYDNPTQDQIDEIREDTFFRCNYKNMIGFRDNRPEVFVKFRSGKTIEGSTFWDQTRLSIVKIEPKIRLWEIGG